MLSLPACRPPLPARPDGRVGQGCPHVWTRASGRPAPDPVVAWARSALAPGRISSTLAPKLAGGGEGCPPGRTGPPIRSVRGRELMPQAAAGPGTSAGGWGSVGFRAWNSTPPHNSEEAPGALEVAVAPQTLTTIKRRKLRRHDAARSPMGVRSPRACPEPGAPRRRCGAGNALGGRVTRRGSRLLSTYSRPAGGSCPACQGGPGPTFEVRNDPVQLRVDRGV